MKKNAIVFFGIIALIAMVVVSISSCDLELKGGTFELVNNTGVTIYYKLSIDSSVNIVDYPLSNGEKATLDLDEDGKVYYGWGYDWYALIIYTGVKQVSGGETVTVRAY